MVPASHNQLQSLSVRAVHRHRLDGCLREDLLPPSSLESLTLLGTLVNATKWIHELQNHSKLLLQWSEMRSDDAIQALGVLPNIEALRLMYTSFLRTRLHFQSSYSYGAGALWNSEPPVGVV
jgi:hypothetical protein